MMQMHNNLSIVSLKWFIILIVPIFLGGCAQRLILETTDENPDIVNINVNYDNITDTLFIEMVEERKSVLMKEFNYKQLTFVVTDTLSNPKYELKLDLISTKLSSVRNQIAITLFDVFGLFILPQINFGNDNEEINLRIWWIPNNRSVLEVGFYDDDILNGYKTGKLVTTLSPYGNMQFQRERQADAVINAISKYLYQLSDYFK